LKFLLIFKYFSNIANDFENKLFCEQTNFKDYNSILTFFDRSLASAKFFFGSRRLSEPSSLKLVNFLLEFFDASSKEIIFFIVLSLEGFVNMAFLGFLTASFFLNYLILIKKSLKNIFIAGEREGDSEASVPNDFLIEVFLLFNC
jgi:glycosyltransferase involved in cell wall biosynthesis